MTPRYQVTHDPMAGWLIEDTQHDESEPIWMETRTEAQEYADLLNGEV